MDTCLLLSDFSSVSWALRGQGGWGSSSKSTFKLFLREGSDSYQKLFTKFCS